MAYARSIVLAAVIVLTAYLQSSRAAEDAVGESVTTDTAGLRPTMQQLAPDSGLDRPPSPRDLAGSRAELKRRFREPLSHTGTAVGARLAAETLLTAAVTENDRSLKWLMLDEARQLGEAAGQAGLVNRAITLAAATYDFDAIDTELRCLKQIPLRGLDATRAAGLAVAAEAIATRAEADRRPDKAVTATLLAYRAWQRAGNKDAARQAAVRHDALVHGTTQPRGVGTPVQ